MKSLVQLIGVISLVCNVAYATQWTVDDDGKADFSNIQAAVNAASDGDEIIVMPGTYTSSESVVVSITNKSLWLHSNDGEEVTIIDGQLARSGMMIVGEGGSKTRIEGFTFRNGVNGVGGFGAGLYCESASPIVQDCVFQDNEADNRGGGAYCDTNGNVTFDGCTFERNSATNGGGMGIENASLTLTDCLFEENRSTGSGGGIRIWEGSTVSIQQSAFVANESDRGGGIRVMDNQGQTVIENCLFLLNTASKGAGTTVHNSNVRVTNCAWKKNESVIGGVLQCTGGSSDLNVFDSLFCGNTPANTSGNCGYYEGNLFYEECCDADLTDDQLVNVDDLLIVVSDLNCEQSGNCDNYGSDINGDGAVNVLDLLIIIDTWGYCDFE